MIKRITLLLIVILLVGVTAQAQDNISISKSANPAFAQPGTDVVFTITVTNNGDAASGPIVVSDTVPSEFLIASLSASTGAISNNGQEVTYNIDSIGAGQSVTATINTRLSSSVSTPFSLTNQACVTSPNQVCSLATVTSVAALPSTGESPAWRASVEKWVRVAGSMINAVSLLSEIE